MSVRKLLIDLATFVGVMLVLGAIATSCQGAEILSVTQPSDPAVVWVEFDTKPDSTEAVLLVAQRGDAMVPYWSDLADFVEYGSTWWWVVDFGSLYVGEPVRAWFDDAPVDVDPPWLTADAILQATGQFALSIRDTSNAIFLYPDGAMLIIPRGDWWSSGIWTYHPPGKWPTALTWCPPDSTEATP